jgi:hypothetical protein
MSFPRTLRILLLVVWLYVMFGVAWFNGSLQPWVYEVLS